MPRTRFGDLKLEAVGIPLTNTIYNGLRQLKLSWLPPLPVSMDAFLDVLERCTSLEVLVLASSPPLLNEMIACPNRRRTIKLPHLKSFEVLGDRFEQATHLLSHLSLPHNTAIKLEWEVDDEWDWDEAVPTLVPMLGVLNIVEWLEIALNGGPDGHAVFRAGCGDLSSEPLIRIQLGFGNVPELEWTSYRSVAGDIIQQFSHLFSKSSNLRHLHVDCFGESLSQEIWLCVLGSFPHITKLEWIYSLPDDYGDEVHDDFSDSESDDPYHEPKAGVEWFRAFFASSQVMSLCPRLSTIEVNCRDIPGR